jgi:hypothetical protein
MDTEIPARRNVSFQKNRCGLFNITYPCNLGGILIKKYLPN